MIDWIRTTSALDRLTTSGFINPTVAVRFSVAMAEIGDAGQDAAK